MSNSLNLTASLAQDRHAERYGAPVRPDRYVTQATYRPALGPWALQTTRRRAGWLLVGLGLRLVAGRGRAAAHGASLIGQ